MSITQRFHQPLIGAAAIALLGVACTAHLRDYTQLNLQAKIPADQSEESTEQLLSATQLVLEKRLLSLGVESAEVTTEAPDTVIVRLPPTLLAQELVPSLISPGQLTFRNQKPDTDDKLASGIERSQRLIIEQNTLLQTEKRSEAEALQPQINEVRSEILTLFEPAEITGELLLDAQAVQNTGFNVWDIRLWFTPEGADRFATQTKVIAGTGRAIGIFLDDVLLSTPVVPIGYAEAGILGGEASITGNFTREAAQTIERQLKSGPLPVELELVGIVSSDDIEAEKTAD